MTPFFIDKKSRVPIYLQLKDQIKYFVSTGAIGSEQRLPPIKTLAEQLNINFLTVRKAYKELEHEGLLTIRHGDGCFVSLHQASQINGVNHDSTSTADQFGSDFRRLVDRYLGVGLTADDISRAVFRTLESMDQARRGPVVVFAECNNYQVREISGLLAKELEIPVIPMLISDLAAAIPKISKDAPAVNLVTTGFHVNEVREAIGSLAVEIDVLITNLNPDTRRQLEDFGEDASYSFICRDRESAVLYRELLKSELGFDKMNLTACTFRETKRVRTVLNSSDVVLVSPPVYEDVLRILPPGKAIYNVFERVDPMSLKVLKDRIFAGTGSAV